MADVQITDGRIESGFVRPSDGKSLYYKVDEEKGEYWIYDSKTGSPFMWQYGNFIPHPDLGLEGSCLKQIEDMCVVPEPVPDPLEDRVAAVEDGVLNTQVALTEVYESNVSLSDEVTNVQEALTDVYEQIITLTV